MFLSTLIRVLWASRRGILLTILFMIVGGEVLMRLPFIPQRLEYEPDPDFGGQLAPDQRGYMWLANNSMQGPVITLNQDGFRGASLDDAGPLVLVMGDSEAFGAGVGDDDVWTHRLETSLRGRPGLERAGIANGAHPGFGPEQEAIRLERALKRRVPDLLIVEVEVGQNGFWLPPPDQRPRAYEHAQFREKVRRITRFLPFLIDKITIQQGGVRRAIDPFSLAASARGPKSEGPARRFIRRGLPFWSGMLAEADQRGIPLLFLVWNSPDESADRAIESALLDLTLGKARASVMRISTADFGIDLSAPHARKTFEHLYTLQRDPHTNAKFHKRVAELVLAHLPEFRAP